MAAAFGGENYGGDTIDSIAGPPRLYTSLKPNNAVLNNKSVKRSSTSTSTSSTSNSNTSSTNNSSDDNAEWPSVPYLQLKPVKAIVMMAVYEIIVVIGACVQLDLTGVQLDIDNLLEVLHDKAVDKATIAKKYLADFKGQREHLSDLRLQHSKEQKEESKAAIIQSHSSTMNRKPEELPRHQHQLVNADSKMAAGGGAKEDESCDHVTDAAPELQETARRLEEENLKLRQSRQCMVCKDRVADIILLPCRHISICHQCWNPQVKVPCPKCAMGVAGTFHVFWG